MKNLLILLTLSLTSIAQAAELVLYTDRPTATMQVIADGFKAKTGTDVLIFEASWADLKNKLATEGNKSPADVIMVKDLVYLNELVADGRLGQFQSSLAQETVDPSMVSPYWVAITYRVRTLVYNPSLDVSGISTYADLADPQWAGQLCLRTSKAAYNEALFASIIASYGYDETTSILDGWLNNMSDFAMIYPNDNSILDQIANLEKLPKAKCQLGIVNTYYLGLKLKDNPSYPVAVKFLDLKEGGSHSNGMGAGISASSDQAELAQQFIEFMLNPDNQKFLSEKQQDFPANRTVSVPSATQVFPQHMLSPIHWSDLTEQVKAARQLFEELDYQ